MSQKYKAIVDMWRSWQVRTSSDIDTRLDNFRIIFAYNSGKIENGEITYHDTREIFENGRAVNFTGDPRALLEQGNQKMCYQMLKGKIADRLPMDVSLVLEVHGVLTSGTYDERRFIERQERPGTFKKHDYVIGLEEIGSAPIDVPLEISALLEELQRYEGDDILKAAAYFHLRFEHIHPFADGNGRVGRTLLNYFLMIRDHPPLIIYEDEKATYYAALEAYDKTEDMEAMYDFLVKAVERSWEKTLVRESAA